MFSRVHVYYADLQYRHYSEVPEIPVYLAFCSFSNVVELYLGMSIVSFVHVGFYSIRYWLALRKARHETKKNTNSKISRNKVCPKTTKL
jgi:hypothetical protein